MYNNAVIKNNIKLYTNCGIIVVVLGIILSIMGHFWAVLKSIIGKKLSIIGQRLSIIFHKEVRGNHGCTQMLLFDCNDIAI